MSTIKQEDVLKKTARLCLLIGWVICLALLASLSMSMMHYLEDFEDPRFRLPHLATLHLAKGTHLRNA